MRARIATVCVIVVSVVGVLAGASSPFIGTWKLDQSKSNLTGDTFKLESVEPGKIRYSHGNQSYTFTTDGKQNPALFGRMSSVKQLDANTWEETTTLKGKVQSVATWTISSDGRTFSELVKGTRPDGTSYENTIVNERQGDGLGLIGTWKTSTVKLSSPGMLEFAENGSDGLTFKSLASKSNCPLKFDGKDYACTGPTVADGVTYSMRKTGERAIEITQKMNNAVAFKHSYEVSADGKTLTITGGAPGSVPTTRVLQRQ